jgi:hypothetical protein
MTTKTTTELRRCIGSVRFGVETHEAPAEEFPVQPSQKDGLGRMCKAHWRAYTNALRKAAMARKAASPKPAPAVSDEGTAVGARSTPSSPARPPREGRRAG